MVKFKAQFKHIFLLPVFLFFFIGVFGQNDTNAIITPKDTAKDANAVKSQAAGRAGKSDSEGRVQDSSHALKHVKKMIDGGRASGLSGRDSGRVRKDSLRVRKDSLKAQGLAGPGTGKDSLKTAGIIAADTSHPQITGKQGPGGITLALMRSVLSASPYFDFTGTPVVEMYEIHRPASKDSLFYLLVSILFYFALIRIFFEKYFSNLMTLFFRVSLRQQQIREQVLQTPLPSLLLNGLFVISGGLYACFLLRDTALGRTMNFWILYIDCMIALGLIYLVKFLVLKFLGWVFNISRATDIYIFIVFLVNKMLGIFLLPFLILITFSGTEAREIYTTISLTMVFVLFLYRIFASYRPLRNEIKLTPFHFFLYLCAFEIAPLLLIYKVLLSYLEKPY